VASIDQDQSQLFDPNAYRMFETETSRLGHQRLAGRPQEIIDADGEFLVDDAPLSGADVLQQQSVIGGEITPSQFDDPLRARESRSCEPLPRTSS
jgi:hypothetical protein